MGSEFVCKIDGMSFLTKQEILTHLSQHHLRTVTTEENLQELKEQLERTFPGFLVEISKDIDFLGEERIDFNYAELSAMDLIYVALRSNLGNLYFAVLKDCQNHFNRGLQIFPTFEEGTVCTQRLLFGIKSCEKQLFDLAREHDVKLASIHLSRFEKYHDRYENSYNLFFNAVYSDGSVLAYTSLSINQDSLETNEEMEKVIQRCVKMISGQYVNFLEGEVQQEYSEAYQSDHMFYTIDGVDIDTLASRSKRMRITIVKEKND
jgi:hypothetical protein